MKKYAIVLTIALVAMLAIVPMIPSGYAPKATKIDILRQPVISSPDAALIAMQTDVADMSPDQIRTADIEKQDSEGFLITQDLGFHMGFIGYNVRDLAAATYGYRPEVVGHFWPLHDVDFRHALIHCYDQLGIIPPIYGYIVTPVRSLVPPAQSKYYNPSVQEHPYNPGNPITSPSTEHSSSGILKAAGYTFQDVGTTGVVDAADYWKMPGGEDMLYLRIYTPLIGVAPTSWQHGQEFVADLRAIGLGATTENGNKGFESTGHDFNEYLNLVYGTSSATGGQFDAFMVFYSLGRVPAQLFSLLHSSQDTAVLWGARNGVGANDAALDALVETVKYSLNTNTIEGAAKTVQDLLYNPTASNADNFALSYMLLYSRSYFNAFDEDLMGIVKSPGYGSDNSWTYFNLDWAANPRMEGTKKVAIYINGDEPDVFNPNFATTVYEWNIIGLTQDGLTAVNPYNHNDIPWIATSWTITEVGGGMEIDFVLRNDVYWQDGIQFTAYDVEFCLEYLRDHQVPRYWETSETLTDVVVTDATHCKVIADLPSLDAFWDFSGLAPLLPPQIWDRPAWTDQDVLDYQPELHAYGTDMAPTYSPGPWASLLPTNVFGTGPFVFQFYDAINQYDDLWANTNYWLSQTDIATLMTQMFWEVGDQSKDGTVNVIDLTFVSFAYGAIIGDPEYDANSDFNTDGIVDMRDMRTSAFHLLWKKTHG